MIFQFKKKFEFLKGVDTTFLNPYSYLFARKNPKSYNDFILHIDGEWLRKFVNLFGKQEVERVSFDFTSIANDVFLVAQSSKLSVSIVGSTMESNELFLKFLHKKYPHLLLKHCRSGFFEDDKDKQEYIEKIVEDKVDIVIVGMGAPLQERLLMSLRSHQWQGSGFTCGGFIHQTASKQGKYYPDFFDKYNLRFLYRMYDEPQLIKRYLVDYPKFAFYFLIDLLQAKR